MDKSVLEELYHVRKEIEKLNDRITTKKGTSQFAGDVVQNGYKGHAYIYGIDVIRKDTIKKLCTKYNSKVQELNKLILELEDYIESIPFAELRNIFRFRYINNLTWIQVAHEMNELYKCDKYSESSVRHKHDRFLEEN